MTGYRTNDNYLAIPDLTLVSLHNAIGATGDPLRVEQLTATMRAWLQSTDRIGTILDTITTDGLDDVIEFRTPDGQIMTIPVYCARDIAAGLTKQYALPVTRSGDNYRVLMTEWPTTRRPAA